MSQLIDLNLRPDPKVLRQFGFVALVGFGLLAVCAWFEWLMFAAGLGEWRSGVAGTLAGLAAVSLFFSLVYPKANLPVYVGLTLVALPIGFVLSHLILGALFFGLIGPVALVFRAIGRDPMKRRLDPDAESYWTEARPTRPSEDYFRQF